MTARCGHPMAMTRTASDFESLLTEYFEGVLADNPPYAAYNGIQKARGQLGRSGHSFEATQQKRREKTLARLNSLSPRELTREQQLDRLALRSQLLHECEDFERRRHALDP